MIPPVVAAPPSLWVARPPSLYSHRMRILRHRLREHTAPYAQQLKQVTALRSLRFPELRLVQFDSGMRGAPVGAALFFSHLFLRARVSEWRSVGSSGGREREREREREPQAGFTSVQSPTRGLISPT